MASRRIRIGEMPQRMRPGVKLPKVSSDAAKM